MNKIIVIGCSGSGKSTFARKLSALLNLPLYYLDMIWHKPDKTTITQKEFDAKLNKILKEYRWIIDGNYQRTLEMRLKKCDSVFLFDISTELCLEGAKSRIGKQRVDLPWLETEFDDDFKQWIYDYKTKTLPITMDLLKQYQDEKQVIIFKSREESEEFLKKLSK